MTDPEHEEPIGDADADDAYDADDPETPAPPPPAE